MTESEKETVATCCFACDDFDEALLWCRRFDRPANRVKEEEGMTEPKLDMPPHVHKRILARRERIENAIFLLALGALAIIFALFGAGCSTYTVVSADRRLVPVRHAPEVSDEVYYRTEGKDATGWYVPDALMLEILDAK